jgi:hypothetical protein
MGTELRPLLGHQIALPHVGQIVLQFIRNRAANPISRPLN